MFSAGDTDADGSPQGGDGDDDNDGSFKGSRDSKVVPQGFLKLGLDVDKALELRQAEV